MLVREILPLGMDSAVLSHLRHVGSGHKYDATSDLSIRVEQLEVVIAGLEQSLSSFDVRTPECDQRVPHALECLCVRMLSEDCSERILDIVSRPEETALVRALRCELLLAHHDKACTDPIT